MRASGHSDTSSSQARARHPLSEVLDALCEGDRWASADVFVPDRWRKTALSPSPSAHQHDQWEIIFILHGRASVTDPAGTRMAVFPAIILHPPNWVHDEIELSDPATRTRVFAILAADDHYTVGLTDVAGNRDTLRLPPLDMVRLRRRLGVERPSMLFDAALTAFRTDKRRTTLFIRALVLAWIHALRLALRSEYRMAVPRSIREHVDENIEAMLYSPGLRVLDITHGTSLSPSELSRRYKRESGTTIHQALLTRRLSRARELLESGTCNVKEAARRTGWKTQHYFSNAFTKRFGVRPSHVRPRL